MESGEEADVSYVLNYKIFWNWSWDLGAVQNSLMFVANTEQVMSFFVFLTVWNTLPLGHPTSPNVTATLKQSLSRYFVCANYFTFFSALKVTVFFFGLCPLYCSPFFVSPVQLPEGLCALCFIHSYHLRCSTGSGTEEMFSQRMWNDCWTLLINRSR